jgi:transcriptional regulator with XRE-family HTH domain
MRRRATSPAVVPVPFEPRAAWSARRVLGLTPALVARDMASHGVTVSAPQVIAWESGELLPTERELVALARTLWCAPGQLMGGRARSIRDHRLSVDMPLEELARRLNLTPRVYAQLESAAHWEGDTAQTFLLAEALQLTPYGLVLATDREEALRDVLQRAVEGRAGVVLGDVGGAPGDPAGVLGLDLGGGLGQVLRGAGAQHHVRALARRADRDLLAEPGAHPGHHHRTTIEQRHG